MDASESLGPEEQLTVPEAALLPFAKPIWLSTLSALDLSACWALIRRWAYSRKLGSIISDCIPRNYIKWHTGTYEGPRRNNRSQNYPPCPAGSAVWYTNNPIAARLTSATKLQKAFTLASVKTQRGGKALKTLRGRKTSEKLTPPEGHLTSGKLTRTRNCQSTFFPSPRVFSLQYKFADSGQTQNFMNCLFGVLHPRRPGHVLTKIVSCTQAGL